MRDEELQNIERDVTGNGFNLHSDATRLLAEVKLLRCELAARERVIVGARAYAKSCERFARTGTARMMGLLLSRLEPGARSLYEAIAQYDDDTESGHQFNAAALGLRQHWTRELPKSAGLYWYREMYHVRGRVVDVVRGADDVLRLVGDCDVPVDAVGGQWCGPLVEPEDVW